MIALFVFVLIVVFVAWSCVRVGAQKDARWEWDHDEDD